MGLQCSIRGTTQSCIVILKHGTEIFCDNYNIFVLYPANKTSDHN